MRTRPPLTALLILVALPLPAAPGQDARDFFENRIRPVLAEHCYRCHNSSGEQRGGLALDHRAALRRGGDSGPAMIVGHGNESLLVRAIRHVDDGLRMPAEGAKLNKQVAADLVKWIDDGALDPRDTPPTPSQLKDSLSWDEVRRRRMAWWCWQPVTDPVVPKTANRASENPVDRFVQAKLEAAGLEPTPRADSRALMRRVSFVLTGLPPTPEEMGAFLNDGSPGAYDRLVDRLLAAPEFGERWARHWMDWVRYADSHGSEGDPGIPHAWRYRDYLIRALNADVPFDKLLVEHVAGDLLPNPRINTALGINESRIGTAQYRLVQHGFAPTDALEEQVRFTDNQIDVLSKAFLGLTVSCARCHDHKFDAIGQSDFYALYGVLASCRPALITIDTNDRLETNKQPMGRVKDRLKRALARAWLAAVDRLPGRLSEAEGEVAKLLEAAAKDANSPLHAWARSNKAGALERTWASLTNDWKRSLERLEKQRRSRGESGWTLSGDHYREWFRYGVGLGPEPTPAGGFHVLPDGDRVVSAILPAGVFTHLASSKHNGVLTSPRIRFDMKSIHVRVMGNGGAKARYVVQNYPRGGTVYPSHGLSGGGARWVRWDMTYWRGDHGYLELSTAADHPVEHNANAKRSWFGITDVALVSEEQAARNEVPRDEQAQFVSPLFEAASTQTPTSRAALAALYVTAVRACVTSWAEGKISDAQANFLSFFVSNDLLPTRLPDLPEVAPLVREYRTLEDAVPVPTRVPG
ncbi:MAG: hypothetical protein CMJ90_13755, partial [Planctomycetes bacterium]|nr:hypothetical protein [Planctomycetota bacterium]